MRQKTTELRLKRTASENSAVISFCALDWPDINHAFVQQTLHPKEQTMFYGYPTDRRQLSFLRGRYAAKSALIHYASLNSNQICIESGVFQQPIVTEYYNSPVHVSITHTDTLAAAVAFPEGHPMGIDIQDINSTYLTTIEQESTVQELKLIRTTPYPYGVALTLLWTAKESLSKILKTGLTTPLSLYELKEAKSSGKGLMSTYTHFYQYQTYSFILQNHACSISYPKLTNIDWNPEKIGEMTV